MPTFLSYVICTTPRSGSTLLCNLLAQTGVAGNPQSHFHEPSIDAWLGYYDLQRSSSQSEQTVLESIFQRAIAHGSSQTKMFGLRLQQHSFAFFSEKLSVLHPNLPSDLARFQAAFGSTLFIHLTRDNKIAQAISYLKAEQSGLWHVASDGTELERLAPPRPPQYDADKIQRHIDELTTQNRAWDDWFANENISPMTVTYETLAADPMGTLRRILEKLDLNRDAANNILPGVAKLSDETNADWMRRFQSERVTSKDGVRPTHTGLE